MAPQSTPKVLPTPMGKLGTGPEDCSDTCSSGTMPAEASFETGDSASQSSTKEEEDCRSYTENIEEQVVRLVKEQGRAKQDGREQRRRLEAAEITCDHLSGLAHRLRREVADGMARERELQARVVLLERDRKALHKLSIELEHAKAAAWQDSEAAAAAEAASQHQIDDLSAQLRARGIEPIMFVTPESCDEILRASEHREAMELSCSSMTEAEVAKALSSKKAAAVEEQRKADEQRRQEQLRREAKERRRFEEEERERERRRLEEEELERQRAARVAMAQKMEEDKKQRVEERKRRKQEDKLRLCEEQRTFSREDFEALQALRQSVHEESDDSAIEGDEDELLEREMERVRREEAKISATVADPALIAHAYGDVAIAGAIDDMGEILKASRRQRQRAALKEKMQMRRQLAGVVGTPSGMRR